MPTQKNRDPAGERRTKIKESLKDAYQTVKDRTAAGEGVLSGKPITETLKEQMSAVADPTDFISKGKMARKGIMGISEAVFKR